MERVACRSEIYNDADNYLTRLHLGFIAIYRLRDVLMQTAWSDRGRAVF